MTETTERTRRGRGRPPLVEGQPCISVSVALTQADVEAVQQWRQAHGSRSASEAIRQMIAVAAELESHDGALFTLA